MNKKSKFITAGVCAIVLGLCMVYQANRYKYQSSSRFKTMVVGTIVLVAGVGSASIGFTSKEK